MDTEALLATKVAHSRRLNMLRLREKLTRDELENTRTYMKKLEGRLREVSFEISEEYRNNE